MTFLVYLGTIILRTSLKLGFLARGRFGGDWYQWIVYLAELKWLFIALVALQVTAGRWPRWFLVLVLLVESGMGVLTGWSSTLPKVLLLGLACATYTRQSISWRSVLAVVSVATIVVIASVPIARGMRTPLRTGQVSWSAVVDSAVVAWGEGVENGWEIFANLLIGRQSAIAQTPAIIMYITPDHIPYLPWQDLAVAPLAIIPRVIWPSKPIYTNSQALLTVQYWGGQPGSGSAAPTMVGDAYMYGGWPVVVIGMFTLGMLAALIYRGLAIPGLLADKVGLLAVYAGVVIANLHLGEGDFVSMWQGLTQRTTVFLAVSILLCVQKHATYQQGAGAGWRLFPEPDVGQRKG